MKNILLLAASGLLLASFRPFAGNLVKETRLVAMKKDAKKLAEYYRQRVLRGESMASIAKLYSEDPGSAPNGGLYNNIGHGQMVPEF